jgi:acetyltransferase-like isoleucine patch superfamily enzyme
MKIFSKEKLKNGRRHIYFCGLKIISYKKRKKSDNTNQIVGQNNIVSVPDNSQIKIRIYGNNNKITVGKHKYLDNFNIAIGIPDCPCDNCTVTIGDDFSCNGASMLLLEDNTLIDIGNDCMFSDQITLWPSDTHTLTDLDGKILNVGKYIKIGNHVWIGQGGTILKNTTISDNCVIGTRSVVAGKFDKPNCAIAGCPAKIVKENIKWDRRRPKQYIKDTK